MEDQLAAPVYDLLIVGAGPVGLATAIAAHNRGCRRIVVVEQAKEFSPTGEILVIAENGLRAISLLAPDVASTLREISVQQWNSVTNITMHEADGTVIELSGARTRSATSSWYNIQTMLRKAMPEDVEVRGNTQVVALRDDNNGEGTVRVECILNRTRSNPYAHWGKDTAVPEDISQSTTYQQESETLTLHAKIVIGADGINSTIRREILSALHGQAGEDAARARYSGYVTYKGIGRAPDEVRDFVEEVERLYFSDGNTIALVGSGSEKARLPDSISLMLVRTGKSTDGILANDWIFIVHTAVPEWTTAREQRSSGFKELRNIVIEQLKMSSFPNAVIKMAEAMLQETTPGNKISVRPLYIVPASNPISYPEPSSAEDLPETTFCVGHGRVFLVGDALHGMPSFLGQGTSMGWEDVVELVGILAQTCDWDQSQHLTNPALLDQVRACYKQSRFERVSLAQAETCLRRWSWDMSVFAKNVQKLLEFTPKVSGWESNSC